MYEVFHSGFSFPVNYINLKTALQVYDKEVQWTLGAILYRTRFLPLRYHLFLQMVRCCVWMVLGRQLDMKAGGEQEQRKHCFKFSIQNICA